MNGVDLVQFYLLAQMRAESLVARSLANLGVGRAVLDAARTAAEKKGLETPGHALDIYPSLLGPPLSKVITEDADPYRRMNVLFQLPLWPAAWFCVYGSIDGATAGLGFVAPTDASQVQIREPRDLKPWIHTEDHLRLLLSRGKILEEWYPQRDHECSFEQSRYALQFDYGLLQQVTLLSDG